MSKPLEKVNIIPVDGPTEPIPVPRSETAAVLHMIERAARDPAVDVDKLRQLMELREKVEARQAERDFDNAMSAVQTEMVRVRADAMNPQTRSKYASYPALDRALRPIYTKNGLSLSFNTEDGPPDCLRVVCYVGGHGHTRKYKIDMPADGKGAKGGDVMTKTHATGSAASYGQRYLLKMIFNIAVGDDDDGNLADGSAPGPISQDQLAQLIALADEVTADKERFCKYMKVDSLAAIPASQFNRARDALNAKRAKQ